MDILLQSGLLVFGFIMLVKGADWFVEGSSGIADRFGIPQIIIGLTIVAFGTSAPEAAISIGAALKGSADLTIGNVVGSNILNILLILGITSIITPLTIQKNTLKYEIPYVVVITIVLLLLGKSDGVISRADGLILWGGMVLFLFYLLIMAKKGAAVLDKIEEDKAASIWKLLGMTLTGLVLIVIGSDFTVDSATKIAESLGISQRVIGLTIVAFGTSLPELITSVTAGIKGKADIAIGNIVGSNIFNILFVVGTAALITPVSFAPNFVVDSLVAIGAAVLLFLCVCKNLKLKRGAGIFMILLNMAYFAYLFMPF